MSTWFLTVDWRGRDDDDDTHNLHTIKLLTAFELWSSGGKRRWCRCINKKMSKNINPFDYKSVLFTEDWAARLSILECNLLTAHSVPVTITTMSRLRNLQGGLLPGWQAKWEMGGLSFSWGEYCVGIINNLQHVVLVQLQRRGPQSQINIWP